MINLLHRNYSHLTPRYIAARLRLAAWEWKNPEAPWLTCAAVEILSSLLKSGDCGLEFGAGRSTLWFSSRVSRLTSIESDENWYEKVKLALATRGFLNIDLRLASTPDICLASVEDMPAESVDFVLVDGIVRVRDRCALLSLPKLKNNGILIIDNVNWHLPSNSRSPNSRRLIDGPETTEWTLFAESVKNWRYIWTSDEVTDTAFFLKPAQPSESPRPSSGWS